MGVIRNRIIKGCDHHLVIKANNEEVARIAIAVATRTYVPTMTIKDKNWSGHGGTRYAYVRRLTKDEKDAIQAQKKQSSTPNPKAGTQENLPHSSGNAKSPK